MTEPTKTKRPTKKKAPARDNTVIELPTPIKPKATDRKKPAGSTVAKELVTKIIEEVKTDDAAGKPKTPEEMTRECTEELARLRAVYLEIALASNTEAVDVYKGLVDLTARLNGLYAPTKTVNSSTVNANVAVQQTTNHDLTKLSYEQLKSMQQMLEIAEVPAGEDAKT